MTTKLAQRAYDAKKLVEDSSFKQRAKKLESIGELGFALILYWNQIEVALKLMYYDYKIKDGWPDKLNFINTTWKPLSQLKANDLLKFNLILSSSNDSLWKLRNKIAHQGDNTLPITEYEKYVEAAQWVTAQLKQKVPNLERVRDKKRHSDAQLHRIK